ncbi:MAG: hypothetical protein ABIL09_10865 [Gemmatimonadota bacterium]
MGDRGGKRDKEKNKKEMIKKREDKAKKAQEKNHGKPAQSGLLKGSL